MKIIVLVKEVPDTYGDRKLNLETGLADRGASESVIDEIGERARLALTYADANEGAEVAILSLAPESATATIARGLRWAREAPPTSLMRRSGVRILDLPLKPWPQRSVAWGLTW